jgi:hypothetical protein
MKFAVGVGLCCLLSGSAVASQPVAVTANPMVSMAPATVVLNVVLEPDERNRSLIVVADSEDFYSSSEVSLDGDRAARQQRFTMRNLPPGEYVVQARVRRADNSERMAETHLLVTGF